MSVETTPFVDAHEVANAQASSKSITMSLAAATQFG